MTSQTVLDLKGIPSPISLLKFKSRLKGMAKGEVLEIFSHDFDLAQDLETIVSRSSDTLLLHENLGDSLRLLVQKG